MSTTVLLVTGPPATTPLWTAAAERLSARTPTRVLDLFDGDGAPTVAGRAEALARALDDAGPDAVLVAHGLALPAAMRAAGSRPGQRLVIANGPIGHLDPVTAGFSRAAAAPGLLAATALRPELLLTWLASSAGLRRAVRNPYVMDRDTVVTVCAPLLERAEQRKAVARYLRSLPDALRSTPRLDGPVLAVWGDEDHLYPPSVVDEARLVAPRLEHVAVSGGRWMHPVERPWELADAVADWVERTAPATRSAAQAR